MTRLPRRLALASLTALGLAFGAGAANAEETLFVVGDGVPSSLNADGPAGTYPPTQEGILNLLDTLVTYPLNPPDADGTQTFDFTKIQPELAISWSFDAATNTWTMKLRQGVKSCAGNPFTADDVLYTFARAKSISGQAPVAYFLSSVGSLKNFTPALFGKTPEAIAARKLGDEVSKVDDYTVRLRFVSSYGLFPSYVANNNFMGTPKHYVKQFMPPYTPEADLDKAAKAAGYADWAARFQAMCG